MSAKAPPTREELESFLRPFAQTCPFNGLHKFYKEVVGEYGRMGEAALGRVDRFYLLCVLLHRPDAVHPWLYARCREVESAPDGYLDLWAREHYKSTIITFAGAVQEIVNDPEVTIGIFSHTKPTAKKFLLQLKLEFEGNEDLKLVYPDVFWRNPKLDAPTWSEDKGITVRRKGNPRESTIEAHGLVDGQPTGSHFKLRIYDDVVTLESVTTPEQVKKTTEAHDISDNLGARGEDGIKRAWRVGTRYKFGDTYQDLIDRRMVKVRLYPATDDGTKKGNPVLVSRETLDGMIRDQPSAIFAAQQLLNPAAGVEALFRIEWVKFTDIRPATLTVYIMCDPASSRKRGRDSTAIFVVGIDAQRNKYLLDGYSHKMGLSERWQKLRDLYVIWSNAPGVQFVKVGYERYGLLDALEHFEERMLIEKLGFEIVELAWPAEGGNAKYDRIQRLEPEFKNGRFYLAAEPFREEVVKDEVGHDLFDSGGKPVTRMVPIVETRNQRMVKEQGQAFRVLLPVERLDHEGQRYSLNKVFLDQYARYPYVNHDDNLDCVSRIFDMDPAPPVLLPSSALEPEIFVDGI
jgi:hypothetical protein